MATKSDLSSNGSGGGHEATGMMRWLLTYADLITLLLIVFIVMYAYSQVDAQKFKEAAQSLNQAFGTKKKGSTGADGLLKNNRPKSVPNVSALVPAGFGIPSVEIKNMANIKKRFERALGGAGQVPNSTDSKIHMSVTERGLVISFAGQLLFELGKADIKPEMGPILLQVTNVFRTTTNPVRVEGFTDDRPIRTAQYASNWELSTARATSVLRYFIERGGLPPQRFSAAGYGEHKPVYPNNSDHNRALNRRVDIVLLYESLSVQEPKSIR